jgi:hypothetical protein
MRWHLAADREHDTADDMTGVDWGPDAAFWATPVGQAARAKLRGDRFFQIELDGATLAAYAETVPAGGGRRVRRTCDLLGQIEELGWQLEHVSWWRVGDDIGGDDVAAHAARHAPGADHVRGVYLFHAVSSAPSELVTAGFIEHPPQHRREVS